MGDVRVVPRATTVSGFLSSWATVAVVGQYKSRTKPPVMAHLAQPKVQPGAKVEEVGKYVLAYQPPSG